MEMPHRSSEIQLTAVVAYWSDLSRSIIKLQVINWFPSMFVFFVVVQCGLLQTQQQVLSEFGPNVFC